MEERLGALPLFIELGPIEPNLELRELIPDGIEAPLMSEGLLLPLNFSQPMLGSDGPQAETVAAVAERIRADANFIRTSLKFILIGLKDGRI